MLKNFISCIYVPIANVRSRARHCTFDLNFWTLQFDPDQNDRCYRGPKSQTLVKPKEVVSVRIRLVQFVTSVKALF